MTKTTPQPTAKTRLARATPAPRTARRVAADETKQRLLDLAWDVVRREGLAGLTLRRLATLAGVAVGLTNLHFGSREGLVDQLRIRAWDTLDQRIERVLGPFSAAPPPDFDYEAAIRRGIDATLRFALAEPALYALLTPAAGQTLSDTVLAREVVTARRLVTLLTQGAAANHLRVDGDPIVLALALWSSVQGAIARMQVRAHPLMERVQARILDTVIDTFVARLRCSPCPAASTPPRPKRGRR